MFCVSTRVGGSTRLVPRRRNLALRTWYAAAAERSRSIQLNVDLRVLTPSWWIERRQRYTSDIGCCGRCASVYRVCIAHALELVTNVIGSDITSSHIIIVASLGLNISETRPDSGMVTMDGLYKLAYGLSNGHTPDDVT